MLLRFGSQKLLFNNQHQANMKMNQSKPVRKAYIQIELQDGKYLPPFISDNCYTMRISDCWDKCVANLGAFKKNVRSIHLGYCDENSGQILAFAWVNQSKLC